MHKLPDCTLPYEHHNSQSPHHPCIPVQMVRKQHSTGTLSPPCLCSNEKHHILIKIPMPVCVCACSFENMFINILLYVCVCVYVFVSLRTCSLTYCCMCVCVCVSVK